MYVYNGLGDRLQETRRVEPVETTNGATTTFSMDLNPSTSLRTGTGLTQALSDGTHTYTYGLGRVAQYLAPETGTPGTPSYFLGDALGSVRQLTDPTGAVTLAKAYSPYGEITQSFGAGGTDYGYTGEFQGGYNELVYLRSRFYIPSMGRFMSRDTWRGSANRPLLFNRWGYVAGNPIKYRDPSGYIPICDNNDADCDGRDDYTYSNLPPNTNQNANDQTEDSRCTSVICLQPSANMFIEIPVLPLDLDKPCPGTTIGPLKGDFWELVRYIKESIINRFYTMTIVDSGALAGAVTGAVLPVSGTVGQTSSYRVDCEGLVGPCNDAVDDSSQYANAAVGIPTAHVGVSVDGNILTGESDVSFYVEGDAGIGTVTGVINPNVSGPDEISVGVQLSPTGTGVTGGLSIQRGDMIFIFGKADSFRRFGGYQATGNRIIGSTFTYVNVVDVTTAPYGLLNKYGYYDGFRDIRLLDTLPPLQ